MLQALGGSDMPETNILDELIGEQLSAVTFVQDYIQLWFDGPGINVINPLSVCSGSTTVASGASGFRDALCRQISKTVSGVEFQTSLALVIRFQDSTTLSISLSPNDYNSPEAFYAHGFKGGSVVA
jgi:hypothetical protein